MKIKTKNAIILCSGGLDSVTTAYLVKNKLRYRGLIILFFDYGQRTLTEERKFSRECAKNLRASFIEIKLNKFKNYLLTNKNLKIKKIRRQELKNTKEESEKFYVPFRNTIFLSYAIALSESLRIKNKKYYNIFVGFKCEGKEAYPDTTSEFVNIMNKLIKVNKLKIKIIAPLIKKDKDEIILLGKKLGVDFKKTYSCYKGINKEFFHCGTCLACRLRQEAFYWSNIKDPTNYKEKMRDFRVAF